MDNQQQLVVAPQQSPRPVKDLVVLGVASAAIGLGVLWAIKEMFPESMPS